MPSSCLAKRFLAKPLIKSPTLQHHLRSFSLHEYQSQGLLKELGISVPRGQIAETPQQVGEIVQNLETKTGGKCILKSQIHGGGRGKGTFDNGLKGGIHKVNDAAAAQTLATQMLGHRLHTKQTADSRLLVKKLYVAERITYDEEWYLSITIDREAFQPAIILSTMGGVDIETVAKEHPQQLHVFHFSHSQGITADLIQQIRGAIKTTSRETENLATILRRLYELFRSKDATLLEINPLVKSSDGTLTCLDAKFSFDDATAKGRQRELYALRKSEDTAQQESEHFQSAEEEAKKHGLVYIRLDDGNIANVVNGAGLAMATNDAIAYYGGASANFLDAGGQATKDTMVKAFEIILRDERVKAVLVNIYGGITKCDMIAESILASIQQKGDIGVPIVVRLQGTNAEQGLDMIKQAGLGIHIEPEFGEAAKTVVRLAEESRYM